MDRQTLQLFSRQLAHWSQELIQGGRFPFRRVETFLPLLTEAGEISPPLLFWINRDSFMAGGFFLLPAGDPEAELATGSACAAALGLRQFVTWGAREITFWQTGDGIPRPHRQLAVAAGKDSPALFRDLLRATLEEMRILAVTGAVEPGDLSPWHLANLCRLACRDALPPLVEAFRMRIAQGDEKLAGLGLSPGDLALRQTTALMLRLITLICDDRLPAAIAPLGLDRALKFALDELPEALRRPLEPSEWELPLPEESAVRLHHLFRRLGQMKLAGAPDRLRQAMTILLSSEAKGLGGFPLPVASLPLENFFINPDRLAPGAAVELAPAPLLGFFALLRHLQREPQPVQTATPFSLGESDLPPNVIGTLHSSRPPTAAERQIMSTRLRRSWPHRRFSLPAAAPRWFWELLHLLGLAGDGTRFYLKTPCTWLCASWAGPLFELFRDQFVLLRLERQEDGLYLELVKGRFDTMTQFHSSAGQRQIPWEQLSESRRALFPLLLDLPEPLYNLLDSGRLLLADSWPEGRESGTFLFSRSILGRRLWQVVGGGVPLPRRRDLPVLFRHGFPLPAAEVLTHLQTLTLTPGQDPPASFIDRELEPWLGPLPSPGQPPSLQNPGRRRRGRPSGDEAEAITRTVFVDGVPEFPRHYLYGHYRPELASYEFSTPLRSEGHFFGRVTLVDQAGNRFEIDGEETARALLLASHTVGAPVALPVDRQLTADLLNRYLADLHRLRRSLIRETHRRIADPVAASDLIGKIWRSLPLPPWELVEG